MEIINAPWEFWVSLVMVVVVFLSMAVVIYLQYLQINHLNEIIEIFKNSASFYESKAMDLDKTVVSLKNKQLDSTIIISKKDALEIKLKNTELELKKAKETLKRFRSTYTRNMEKEKLKIEAKYLKAHGVLLDMAFESNPKSHSG
jgi:biopolymer transport protein ExbB/TolQ